MDRESQLGRGRPKSHTKKHLEFKKNAVNHTTFWDLADWSAGTTIHVCTLLKTFI